METSARMETSGHGTSFSGCHAVGQAAKTSSSIIVYATNCHASLYCCPPPPTLPISLTLSQDGWIHDNICHIDHVSQMGHSKQMSIG